MNKNLIFAFVLILATIAFFNSKFYYNTILNKPHPADVARERVQNEQEKEYVEKKEEENKEEREKVEGEKTDTTTYDEEKDLIDTVAKETEGEEDIDTIWVETDLLIVGISKLGGRIISARTKKFTYSGTENESNYIELIENSSLGGGNLEVNGIDFDSKIFTADDYENQEKIVVEGQDSVRIRMTSSDSKVGTIEKVYTLNNDDYRIGLDIVSRRLDGKRVSVGWEGGIKESEETYGGQSDQYSQRQVHVYARGDVEKIRRKKPGIEERTGDFKWVAVTSKYFLVAIVADQVRSVDLAIDAFQQKGQQEEQQTINYGFASSRTADGNSEEYWFYVGPSQMSVLKEYEIGLDKVLFSGWRWFFWANIWFPALCEFVLWVLTSLQSFVGDYGIAIFLLTVFSKLITFPMTQSSMKSMARMRDVQPKITKIRERYKKDPRKMNEKVMELYREEGINPFNPGCLPMFLQMPIFISLFVVLRKAIELRGSGTVLIPWINDMSSPEVLLSLPFSIPLYGSNIALLPIIMAILTYFQNKATMKDPNQKAMVYIMPMVMLLFFNNFPSGVVLYWTFQSGLQIIQQWLLEKGKRKKTA